MKKSELMELLKDVKDDKEVWLVVKDYEVGNDMWFGCDYESDVKKVVVDESGECYVYVDVLEFMN